MLGGEEEWGGGGGGLIKPSVRAKPARSLSLQISLIWQPLFGRRPTIGMRPRLLSHLLLVACVS